MTKVNDEREKLIEYLDIHCVDESGELKAWHIADFIIADRKRIVDPLVKVSDADEDCEYVNDIKLWEAIDETLKRAGVYDQ